MTSLPSKIGLTLIAVYWLAMVGLTIYATNSDFTPDLRSGGSVPSLQN